MVASNPTESEATQNYGNSENKRTGPVGQEKGSLYIERQNHDQRTLEANSVVRLLSHNKLVSVYGASGVGKSRFVKDTLRTQIEAFTSRQRRGSHEIKYFPLLLNISHLRYKISKNPDFRLIQALQEAAVKKWEYDELESNSDNDVLTDKGYTRSQFDVCIESVESAVDYLRHPDIGFSRFKQIVGIMPHAEPIVIIDEFDDLFRANIEETGRNTAADISIEDAWSRLFHEITDVAEQRLNLSSDDAGDQRVDSFGAEHTLGNYKTVLCFSEDSIALVKQLTIPLPSAMRSTYHLKGFTHESAIKVLCPPLEDGRTASALRYANAARILKTITSSNMSDQRQIMIDKLILSSSKRLLSSDCAHSLRVEKTITGSEMRLARLLLESSKDNSQGSANNGLISRTLIKRLQIYFPPAKAFIRYVEKINYAVSRALLLKKRKFNNFLEVATSSIAHQHLRIADQFAPCISNYVKGKKIGSTAHRNHIGAVVRLFRDARDNPRTVPLSAARSALNQRFFGRFRSSENRYVLSENDFEERINDNPLFLLNDASGERFVKLTSPLVLRSLEIAHQQQRNRSYLILFSLCALLGVGYLMKVSANTSSKIEMAKKIEIESTTGQSSKEVDALWGEIFELNADLIHNVYRSNNPVAKNSWLKKREAELSIWDGQQFEFSPDVDQIVALQFDIYTSRSITDAFNAYENALTTIHANNSTENRAECTGRCTAFIRSVYKESFRYLLQALSAIDPDFRGKNSTLSESQLQKLVEEIRQYCVWGFRDVAIPIQRLPEEVSISPGECDTLFAPPE